jgi:hypothetical protein
MSVFGTGKTRRGKGAESERGFVLLTVVVLTWFLFAMVGTYFIIMIVEKGAIFAAQNTMKAENIAEAGLEEALWEYNFGGADFTGWGVAGSQVSKSGAYTNASGTSIGSYSVTVDNFNAAVNCDPAVDCPFVVSTGTYAAPGGNKDVTIRAQLRPRPGFPAAVTAKDQITFTGNSFTDSYKSNLGPFGAALGGGAFNIFENADVRTNKTGSNGAIDLGPANGPDVIKGDAFTGFGSTIVDADEVTGQTGQKPEKTIKDNAVPANMLLLPSLGDLDFATPPGVPIPPGDYKYSMIKLTGSKTVAIGIPGVPGTVRMWITGDVDIGGTSDLQVASGSTLILYVGGDVDARGNGIANLSGTQFPWRLQVYGLTTCDDVGISGGPDFIGVVKAPQADITLSGNPAFYGAFIGFTFTATGGGGVHFDEYLLDILNEPEGFELDWMRRHP